MQSLAKLSFLNANWIWCRKQTKTGKFPVQRTKASIYLTETMTAEIHRPRWKTLLAFGIIYFVWGSTFFAIRVGVHEVPPLLFAAMRFVAAGLLVYLWATAKKEKQTTARQWLSVVLLAFLIFVGDCG